MTQDFGLVLVLREFYFVMALTAKGNQIVGVLTASLSAWQDVMDGQLASPFLATNLTFFVTLQNMCANLGRPLVLYFLGLIDFTLPRHHIYPFRK